MEYCNVYIPNSRSYLSHFIQANTTTPDLYNPLDWDRFSYVRNNPVNYTDPTGHRPSCDGCGLDFSPDVNEYASIFGLSFTGEWIQDQKWTIIATSALIGNEISNAIGQGLGAAATFVNAFGNLTILSVSRGIICSGCLGQEAYPEIRFIASQVSARLVAHEFGHAFEKAIWRRNGSAYAGTLNPIQFLSSEGAVRDVLNGFVTGFATDPSDGKSRYRRWNGPAPQNGYYSDFIPEQYHGRDFDDWNDVHEGWADMFLNWTFGTFYPNLAGTAMDTWVTTNMADWVNSGR